MAVDMERRYAERLGRYRTTMRNERADCVPIRPFVAEFAAKYAGYSCQEVTHDYDKAFAAARKCAADFDWDATVGNMVYVWTGLTEAIGLKYYGVPGMSVPPDRGFQYLEPGDEDAHMRADEYDALIDDPTAFLFNVWLPRVSKYVSPAGGPATLENNLSFLKGGMAMMAYFTAFGAQNAQLRAESGTAPAISGILKAPFDILADKLRGYMGLMRDVLEQPDKVLAACEALMPHMLHVAMTSAAPEKEVPIGFWMHRGCVPFVSHAHFARLFWPTLKPIIEELWRNGYQTLFYAEGDWNAHLGAFAELPERSIVYHVDRADIFAAHRAIGHKFCLSGGISNYLLGYGTPDDVRACCKKVIDGVARDGGYIMDASAIVQNDAKVENVRAMTDFTREYGVYSGAAHSTPVSASPKPPDAAAMPQRSRVKPGVCMPWEQVRAGIPKITGDEALLQRTWENIDALAYTYIWQCVVSF